jgi:serine phosphatase RsbU (regulator of sigma subunit)
MEPEEPVASAPMGQMTDARTPLRTDLSGLRGLDLHSRYHSARCGGDFFDAVSVGPRVIFFLTDIAGRKNEAHVIAAKTQDMFRGHATAIFGAIDANLMDGTAELVQKINRALIHASNGVHYAPTFVGCFDVDLGILAYINAGGQSAIIGESSGARSLGNASVPMGLFSHFTYEPSMQMFEPEARLLIVTKGVTHGSRGHTEFGAEKLAQLVKDSKATTAAELCEEALLTVHESRQPPWYKRLFPWQKVEPEDMTAVAMVRRGPASAG